MIQLDARGRACPEPVLMVKQAIINNNSLEILVDNNTAVQNITRFANNNGYKVKKSSINEDFKLYINK